ncbi:MAG: Hsp20/alpha crystallin family protein [Agathobacter sp.]
MLMPSIFGESLFDDFLNDFPFFDDKEMKKMEKELYGHHGKNMMKTDVKETETGYELEMDLPGFKKEEVEVSLKDGYLTVRASRGLDKDEQDKKTGRYIRRERYAGACERSFYIGEDITEDDIRGQFSHGILKLMIPKKEAKPAVEGRKYIAIEG